ncbi:unnamed protein product, partial [Discosporangium mesarthrocarpum]
MSIRHGRQMEEGRELSKDLRDLAQGADVYNKALAELQRMTLVNSSKLADMQESQDRIMADKAALKKRLLKTGIEVSH